MGISTGNCVLKESLIEKFKIFVLCLLKWFYYNKRFYNNFSFFFGMSQKNNVKASQKSQSADFDFFSSGWRILLQKCIQNPVKHLILSVLQKWLTRRLKAVNYFLKTLHLRYSTWFWISLCDLRNKWIWF